MKPLLDPKLLSFFFFDDKVRVVLEQPPLKHLFHLLRPAWCALACHTYFILIPSHLRSHGRCQNMSRICPNCKFCLHTLSENTRSAFEAHPKMTFLGHHTLLRWSCCFQYLFKCSLFPQSGKSQLMRNWAPQEGTANICRGMAIAWHQKWREQAPRRGKDDATIWTTTVSPTTTHLQCTNTLLSS